MYLLHANRHNSHATDWKLTSLYVKNILCTSVNDHLLVYLDVTLTWSPVIDTNPSLSIPVISRCPSDSIDHVTTGEGQRRDRLWRSDAPTAILPQPTSSQLQMQSLEVRPALRDAACFFSVFVIRREKTNLYLKKWAYFVVYWLCGSRVLSQQLLSCSIQQSLTIMRICAVIISLLDGVSGESLCSCGIQD